MGGVWTAEPPGEGVTATRTDDGWRLNGLKQYCSGAHSCTHALITANAEDGRRLFAIRTQGPGCRPVSGTWQAIGMAGRRVETVVASDVCVDDTAKPAEEAGASVLPLGSQNPGKARAAAQHALAMLGTTASALWLACTDADSVVPPNWLAFQLAQARAGWEAVVGTVAVTRWPPVPRLADRRRRWLSHGRAAPVEVKKSHAARCPRGRRLMPLAHRKAKPATGSRTPEKTTTFTHRMGITGALACPTGSCSR